MLEHLRGSPQDDDETEAPEGSSDPAKHLAATGGRFEHHPLFPRADGSAETRDITFVSFCRRRASDQVMQNCPEDIPAREVKSWAQVVEWWGGGEYKAVAKDAKHRTVACSPSASGEWLTFDGDSKPFVLRKGDSTPGATVAHPTAKAARAAPSPALAPQDALLDVMTQVLHELRNRRAPAAPTPPAADGLLVAMIQAQAAQATAIIQAQAAQATATSHANAQMMQTLLSIVAQRRAEPATSPVDPTTMALQLITAVQKLAPTPAVAPGLAEQIAMIKALRDLYQPAPVAPTNALQPLVNIFGQVMAADTGTQAERAQTPTVPQEALIPHPPPPAEAGPAPCAGDRHGQSGGARCERVVLRRHEHRRAFCRDPKGSGASPRAWDRAPARTDGAGRSDGRSRSSRSHPDFARGVCVPRELRCRRARGRDPRRPRSCADTSPRGRRRAAGVVVDSGCGAIRTRRRAARARNDRCCIAGAARAARVTIEGHGCIRRASRNRAGGAPGDRAPRADARSGTAARGSAHRPARDRRAESADLADPRGARRRAPEAAQHRRDGGRRRARHGVAPTRSEAEAGDPRVSTRGA